MNNVFVVPRYVNDIFSPYSHDITKSSTCQICYIASIKKQKQNYLAVELLHRLRSQGIDAILHLVGAINDQTEYNTFWDYAKRYDLENSVVYHGVLTPKSIYELYCKNDFSISVSLCETFGRSVMESLASGLPTIVMNKIACLESSRITSNGIIQANSIQKMHTAIVTYLKSPQKYINLSNSAAIFGGQYRRNLIQPLLAERLIY